MRTKKKYFYIMLFQTEIEVFRKKIEILFNSQKNFNFAVDAFFESKMHFQQK